MENRSGAAGDADISRLEDLEREERGMSQVSQFVREIPEPFAGPCGLSIQGGLISSASVLGDGTGDRVIQASVERPKVLGADRRLQLNSEFGDGLTDVTVVVHNLGD